VQDLPAPTLDPQELVSEKGGLRTELMLAMVSVELPVLVSVVVKVMEWKGRVKKVRLAGVNFTTVPIPLRLAVCGLPGALSVIDKVAVRVPICVGWKVTLIVQLAPAARLDPQVFAA
jgi:hypothetical protein